MGFKGAFKCKNYQGRNGKPCDCPCWMEVVEQEDITKELRTTKDCQFQLIPALLVETIKASNRPAAEISAMRGEFVKGFQLVANTFRGLLPKAELDKLVPPNQPPGG